MRLRRFPPIGALLLLAALAITLGPGAWAHHVGPVVYGDQEGEENNPNCAFLAQQKGATWNELKVDEAPPDGTYDDQGSGDNPGGPGGLTITVSNSDGKVIDWSSNMGVDAFVVKGGNRGSNVYFYDGEATGDQRVQSPLNTEGNVPQISHISACYDEQQSNTTPNGDGDGGGGGQDPQGGNDGGQQDNSQQDGGQQDGGTNERPRDEGGSERPSDDGGQQDGGQRPQQQGDQQESGDQQDGGQQDDGGGQRESGDGGGDQRGDGDSQQRTQSGDRQSGGGERTPQDEIESEADPDGEGDVLGESESDDGIAEEDDDAGDDSEGDDEDGDERDEHPFTGASTVFLLLIGLVLLLTGLVGRRELS